MDNRNKHCALDDYFASMFSAPTEVSEEREPDIPTLATVTVLRSDVADSVIAVEAADDMLADSMVSDNIAPALDIASAAIPEVAYMETVKPQHVQPRPVTFAIPEPDESGTLKDLDQLLESVIDIDLENIDLSILDDEEAMAAQHVEVPLDQQPIAALHSPVQESAQAQETEQVIADCQPETTVPLAEAEQTTDCLSSQAGEVAPAISPSDIAPEVEWQNVDLDEQFQALFFETAGVTFAVPLTELGGIHQTENINALFGKPDWFLGIMQYRDLNLSVVDTAKWVMPEQDMGVIDYKYQVQLNESNWVLSCETLLGTETLNRNDVKWRTTPGSRPWLAGMVKSRMCVLLHVTEMIKLLNNGINIHGQ